MFKIVEYKEVVVDARYGRWGGIAALTSAAAYAFGFVMALAVLVPAGYETGEVEAADAAAFIADHQASMYIWTVVIYLVAGIALVVLALALFHRLRAAEAVAQIATAFGLIWAALVLGAGMLIVVDLGVIADVFESDPLRAETVWLSLNAVQEGFGGGIELVGGVWVLLVSWASLQLGLFSKAMHYLGIGAGIAGVLTVVPALAEPLTSVFGLALIVWFTWLGATILRTDVPLPATADTVV